jgi:hypothetical protein
MRWFGRRRQHNRLDREITSHLELEAEDLEERGFSPGDAVLGARRAGKCHSAKGRCPGILGLGLAGAPAAFGLPTDPKTAHAPWFRIIGVVGDTRSIAYNTTAWKSNPQVYLDFRQQRESPIGATNWGSRKCNFLIATDAPEGLASSELQRIVWKLDPELPVGRSEALTKKVMTHLAQPKMRAQVLTGFSGISLFLAAIGLYGVLS